MDKLTSCLYDRDATLNAQKLDLIKSNKEVQRLQALIVQYEIRETAVVALETECAGLRSNVLELESRLRKTEAESLEEREVAAEQAT